MEKAHFNPTIQLVVVNLYAKFEITIFKGCGDISDEKSGKEKRNKYKEEQIGESPFSIPRCISNLKFLS